MYELTLPGSLTVFPTPEATLSRPEPGLRHGLLLWVLAGHAAAVWLAFEQVDSAVKYVEPKVLSVRWITPESRPVPAPAVPARIEPPKPRPAKRLADPVPVQPQARTVAEPVAPIPPAPPVEAPPMVVPATPPAAAPVHAAPPLVEEPIPPSYHADYLANPAPEYPSLSRRFGEEGEVRLRVHVSADGLPLEISLAAGSGHPRLDQAAREAVAGWRFVPARLGARPVAGWVVVPIFFSLRR